jgi:signal transduction histidine kinase
MTIAGDRAHVHAHRGFAAVPHEHDRACCSECCPNTAALRAVSAAVLAVASDLSVDSILRKIVDLARELVSAKYAALGVPDGRGGFASFITSGMTSEEWDAIGPLPRTHGLLATVLYGADSHRSLDIRLHPSFEGWPEAHPDMASFLGVPIVSKGRTIGAFYLTDKLNGVEFSESDQEQIETLAAHAAIAIENARLYGRIRELTVVDERNRLARELHDSVSQQLFSIVLHADAAATLLNRDSAAARAQVEQLQTLARDLVQEMRSLVFELRPAEIEADGLVATLRKHVEVLGRVLPVQMSFIVKGERRFQPELEREVFRVAQEALNNAVRHSKATSIAVSLRFTVKAVHLVVSDNGCGFEPDGRDARASGFGLTSMGERARETGGRLLVRSQPGHGCKVSLEAPLG